MQKRNREKLIEKYTEKYRQKRDREVKDKQNIKKK